MVLMSISLLMFEVIISAKYLLVFKPNFHNRTVFTMNELLVLSVLGTCMTLQLKLNLGMKSK